MHSTVENQEGIDVQRLKDGFEVRLDGCLILRHTLQSPCVFVGNGEDTIQMYRGNYEIEDYVEERFGLRYAVIEKNDQGYHIELKQSVDEEISLSIELFYENHNLKLKFGGNHDRFNRFWIRIQADLKGKGLRLR